MKKSPGKFFTLIPAFLLAAAASFGQNKKEATLYEAFDKTIQAKNAAFNNGKIHFNKFRSADKTHRYYILPDFTFGELTFDGQTYGNISLKYDLLKDELVVKLEGEGNKMGFSPVKPKTNGFTINGVKFKNLDLVTHPDFVNGFYEESSFGNLTLYTKHIKDQFDILTGETVFYTYKERQDFLFSYADAWYKIDSQREVAKVFPSLEQQISEFYRTNAPLEKANLGQFMKKLAGYLSLLINTEAK